MVHALDRLDIGNGLGWVEGTNWGWRRWRGIGLSPPHLRHEDVEVARGALNNAHESERRATDDDPLEAQAELEQVAVERFNCWSGNHWGLSIG